MRSRKSRLPLIAALLADNVVRSQNDLMELLAAAGHSVTQATLSRDLRLLKTTKVATDDGGYRYVVPEEQPSPQSAIGSDKGAMSRALSVAISGNIVVIKTRNGYASGLAYDIDLMASPRVLGTIPGADTVFVVVDERSSRTEIFDLFSSILPCEVMEAARDQFLR